MIASVVLAIAAVVDSAVVVSAARDGDLPVMIGAGVVALLCALCSVHAATEAL